MALYGHLAFATATSGEVVSAREIFQLAAGSFTCPGCAHPVQLRFARKGAPYFCHTNNTSCLLGAQQAVRAAALQVLVRTSYIWAPSLAATTRPASKKAAKAGSMEQWVTSEVDAVVNDVPVDLLADTLAGQLAICFSLPGLTDPLRREAWCTLDLPLLEVPLTRPASLETFAELKQLVIEEVGDKRWLAHPALDLQPTPLEKPPTPAARISVPAPPPVARRTTTVTVDNASFRAMSVVEKIALLEKRMGSVQAKWPDTVDLTVRGGNAFGVDHSVWQADVFSKFIRGAVERHQQRTFSSETVLQWLCARYEVLPLFPHAENVAIYDFLHELSQRGILLEHRRQHYSVAPSATSQKRMGLVWKSEASLSVSTLRSVSEAYGFNIPLDLVQRLLESFDDGHPAINVDAFCSDIAFRLHVPTPTVVDFMKSAGLVERGSIKTAKSRTTDFDEDPGFSNLF